MAGKSYNNNLVEIECSLAIEQFLIAEEDTTFTAARVDVDSPPTGYMHLGTVVEDTPTIRMTREKYQLELGIPRGLAYEAVIAVSGEISFGIHSNSFWQAQFALGNVESITTVTTIASGSVFTQYYGTATNQKYAVMGVADFIDGRQVVHEFRKCSPADDFEETFRSEAPNMPFTFNAISYITTVYGAQRRIVGMRHFVEADGT
jgi:hypothetical protein